jgi:hypothetical protein
MADLDKRIADLEARVAKYDTELGSATSAQEKRHIRHTIIDVLLDEKKKCLLQGK